jgi:alpha-N-arabinofuranosidase
MYLPFQDSTLLPSELASPEYKLGEVSIPMVSVSSARAADGSLVLGLVNTDPNKGATVKTKVAGATPQKATGRLLTSAAMNTHNTFEQPTALQPTAFTGAKRKGDEWSFELPAKSVVVVTLR